MRFLLPLLLLTSCAEWPRGLFFIDTKYPVAFTTRCGVEVLDRLRGEPPLEPQWTLAAVQELEDRALKALATTTDVRFANGCDLLRGWDVMVVPSKNFFDKVGGWAGGDTDCGQGRIFIGNSAPLLGRLGHEFAHAIQRCQPLDDGRYYTDPHWSWENIGIPAALRAEGLPE